MLLKLDTPKILVDAVSLISELVTEVRLRVDERGMGVVAIDPANVCLVSFLIPKASFSRFESEEEVLGVSIESLKAILRRSGSSSSLVFESEDGSLKIEIHDKIKRVFNLALINIDAEEKTVPNLDYKARIEMNSEDFLDAIEDCNVVADSCSFMLEKEKFVIEARGLNSTRSEFSGDEVKIEGEGKAKYSIEYLGKIVKACKVSEKASLGFSSDYPLKVGFKKDELEIFYILAPRSDSED